MGPRLDAAGFGYGAVLTLLGAFFLFLVPTRPPLAIVPLPK